MKQEGYSSLSDRVWPHVGRQDAFPQPDAFRRDFHELVVVDELDGLLEPEQPRRNQANGLVGADEARMFVCFFSFVTLTSMSLGRAFSPTIMPS